MMLAEAVQIYVRHRRAEGAQFVSAEQTLMALCRRAGAIDLDEISQNLASSFVRSPRAVPTTALCKYSILKGFVDFWVLRGYLRELVLYKPEGSAPAREPFIFTQLQVRTLLADAEHYSDESLAVDGKTLRMLFLTLFCTGARSGEVLAFRRDSLDLKRRQLRTHARFAGPSRVIPLGRDLLSELSTFLGSEQRSKSDSFLFGDVRGRSIRAGYLQRRFVQLIAHRGLITSAGHSPRLVDLRFSFAVHRLTHWIQQRADLNTLIPALSTYMGYASLTKAEHFLAYTPERFKADLMKLSPERNGRRWRDKPRLLSILSTR